MAIRSTDRVMPATAMLVFVFVAGCTRDVAEPTIQDVVDAVSQEHYREYQLAIENMGLGLYGGPEYDMGYRNRDAFEGAGSLGNRETRKYLQDLFSAMGLSVSVQGDHMNVVGELAGREIPEKIYIIGGHFDHLLRRPRNSVGVFGKSSCFL